MTGFGSTPPCVLQVGACSPLGLTAVQVATSVRAGILEPRATRLLDKRGNTAGAVHARFLASDLYGPDRLLALGAPALAEAAAGLCQPVPLVVALPEATRPDSDDRLGPTLIADLAAASGVALDLGRAETVRGTSASYAAALERAEGMLADGSPLVLLGAIDSFYHPAAIRWLDESCRLHADETEDGIIPSEGAAFVLLGPQNAAGQAVVRRCFQAEVPKPLARLALVVHGEDRELLELHAPVLGTVLTDLVRQGTAALGDQVRWVLTDVYEHHDVVEWTRARIRCAPALGSARLERLPDALGSTGVASGALALALACTQWETQCAPAPAVLVVLLSQGTERAVIVAEAVS